MRKILYTTLLLGLSGSLLWAEHFRFSRFYGPGSFYSYGSLAASRFHRLTPYGHSFYGHPRFYRPGFYGHRPGGFYGPGFYRGYGYPNRVYPARYYTNYATRGTYAVYLGPSNPANVVRANYSDLIFNVSPGKALVYVDGSLIGSARSFATHHDRFPIVEGEHQLRIEFPGYQPFETSLQVVPDRNLYIDVTLEPGG